MFRNTKIDGNEKEKKAIEIEEEEGKRRNNKQERRKIQFQERGTTQQAKCGEKPSCVRKEEWFLNLVICKKVRKQNLRDPT